ncbi:MFS transporter [Klebsiella oxytoca]
MLSRRRGVNTTMTTINHTPAGEQGGKKRLIHRFSWVSLLVCWLIWVLNAYDREMILRLGPVISKEFSLSPEQWGNVVALIMVALAVLDIPGSIWSDRYGSGWKRARFQVPLVLGYTALSFLSGIKAISHGLTAFVLLRVGVNLGAGWGEPVGVSNTAEWWPKEKRGFALGVHHTGYPIGALLSGVVASLVLSAFGEGRWRYCFLLALIVAIPLMIFWAKYSTADRINTLYLHIDSQGMTRPATQESSHVAKGEGMKTFLRTLRNRNISLTAGNTLLTQIVYMGINVVLPPYLYHVSGLSLAASAGLSIIFTLTGTLGQIIWPWLSDSFGRKRTLIVCGLWMSIGIALFYFATNMPRLIAIQLFFGLVANAVWPIYYAMASDSAEERATSTANGIITTAMFIGGGISPLLMGWLIQFGGGWENPAGYIYAFFTMAGCALLGMLLQLMTTDKTPRKAH